MSIIDTVKDTVSLIQQVDNIDLYRRMMELSSQVYALFEENRVLKERASIGAELSFAGNWYHYRDGFYCSRCWDAEALLMRLHQSVRDTGSWRCPKCNTLVVDEAKYDPYEGSPGF